MSRSLVVFVEGEDVGVSQDEFDALVSRGVVHPDTKQVKDAALFWEILDEIAN